jgi:CheY-like chemotaxis protein
MDAPELLPQAPAQEKLPVPADLHVLLVDDDEFNLMVLSDHFSLPGVQITTAINGRVAIEAVKQQRHDLIVMDLEMPVMNGTAAMQEIRRLQAALGSKPSTIVACSGNGDPASQATQIAQGFDSCLDKPIKREQVHALLGRW